MLSSDSVKEEKTSSMGNVSTEISSLAISSRVRPHGKISKEDESNSGCPSSLSMHLIVAAD